jgi:hypothetical protein
MGRKWAAEQPTDSTAIADAPAATRSRITNGSVVLPGVDGRSTWVRRFRGLIALHVSDLGGDKTISEPERSIVRSEPSTATPLVEAQAPTAVDFASSIFSCSGLFANSSATSGFRLAPSWEGKKYPSPSRCPRTFQRYTSPLVPDVRR